VRHLRAGEAAPGLSLSRSFSPRASLSRSLRWSEGTMTARVACQSGWRLQLVVVQAAAVRGSASDGGFSSRWLRRRRHGSTTSSISIANVTQSPDPLLGRQPSRTSPSTRLRPLRFPIRRASDALVPCPDRITYRRKPSGIADDCSDREVALLDTV
jgi:hypothetical protein